MWHQWAECHVQGHPGGQPGKSGPVSITEEERGLEPKWLLWGARALAGSVSLDTVGGGQPISHLWTEEDTCLQDVAELETLCWTVVHRGL